MRKLICLTFFIGCIGLSSGCSIKGISFNITQHKEESCFIVKTVLSTYLQSHKLTNENLQTVRDYLVLAKSIVRDPKEVSFNTIRKLIDKIVDKETKNLAIFALNSVEMFASKIQFNKESETRDFMVYCLDCAILEISTPE